MPMPPAHQKTIARDTRRGEVRITSFCTPEQIEALSLRQTLPRYSHFNPIVSNKSSLVKAAAEPDTNVTVAATADGQVAGFAILEYPSAEERWLRVGERIMMEVSVVEVTRSWRQEGLAGEILRLLVDHPLRSRRILYMVGYSWSWDLEGTGMEAIVYRGMMIDLFTRFGFQVFQTNEANIMLRPENLFMAKIGAEVPESVRRKFKLVRFNLDL